MALSPYGYVDVAVRGGTNATPNASIQIPKKEVFFVDDEYSLASMIQIASLETGSLPKNMDMIWRAYHGYRENRRIRITVAAAAGDTSIVTPDYRTLKKYGVLYFRGGSANARTTADPTTSPVAGAALASAIDANTECIYGGINAIESWPEPTGLNREIGYHTEYMQTFQRVIDSTSWHAIQAAH